MGKSADSRIYEEYRYICNENEILVAHSDTLIYFQPLTDPFPIYLQKFSNRNYKWRDAMTAIQRLSKLQLDI